MRQLISENVENVSFKKSPHVNEPYRICSETAEKHALDVTIKQSEAENFGDISEAAKIIRKELQHQPKWRFNGTFEDFKTPMQLRCFIAEVLTTK